MKRRFLAILLLLSLAFAGTASADSNSRRITNINLAAGIGFGDIEDISDIDMLSLQTIAVFLSNFYQPFVTVLDENFVSEDNGATKFLDEMISALVKNCGFDKDVATQIVKYVSVQSLSSCKPLYMKTERLEKLWSSYLGVFNPMRHISSSASGLVLADDDNKAGLRYSSDGFDAYSSACSVVDKSGESYTQISYAIFSQLMSGYCEVTEGVYNVVVDVGDIELFAINNGVACPVFSADRACAASFYNGLAGADLINGYGNAMVSVTDVEGVDPRYVDSAFFLSPNMYVNWEGSLVLDNGVYRTVVVPGCSNPYMVRKFENTGDVSSFNWLSINNLCLAEESEQSSCDYIVVLPPSVSGQDYGYWRVRIGDSATVLDGSGKWFTSSWGANEDILTRCRSIPYIVAVDFASSEDKCPFPMLSTPFVDAYGNVQTGIFLGNKGYGFYSRNSLPVSGRDTDPYIKTLVYFDSFEAITSESDIKTVFKTVSIEDLLPINSFGHEYATFGDIREQGHVRTLSADTKSFIQSLYITYCLAGFNSDSTDKDFDEDKHIVNMRFNFESFPAANEAINWKNMDIPESGSQLSEQVMTLSYYLLHPTEGVGYVATLFKNKVAGILLGWHEDIVGSSDSNSTTGMTKYLSTSSYTTMPGLYDVSWIASLLDAYNSIIVYLIILITLIMFCYVLTGSMTLVRGVLGIIGFGVCAFLPPLAINTATDTVNAVSDAVYSEKFDYWAICQLQTFLQEYTEAMEAKESGKVGDYVSFLISNGYVSNGGEAGVSETSYSGVRLKWMSPKKYNSLSSITQMIDGTTSVGQSSANFLRQSLLNTISSSTQGQSFLEANESLFLYRDYTDIYRIAHVSYNLYEHFNYDGGLRSVDDSGIMHGSVAILPMYYSGMNDSTVSWAWGSSGIFSDYVLGGAKVDLGASTPSTETSSVYSASRGFLYDTIGIGGSLTGVKNYYVASNNDYGKSNKNRTFAVSYIASYNETYKEVCESLERLNNVISGSVYVDFKTPGTSYNVGLTKSTGSDGHFKWGYQEIIGLNGSSMNSADIGSVRAIYSNLSDLYYGLYSESPFYYFNNNIRDQISTKAVIGGISVGYSYDFGNLLGSSVYATGTNQLTKLFLAGSQDYFFNFSTNAGDGFGEMRDFMNMHDFFYYVVPYLRGGVELARLYDSHYGLSVDSDCSLVVNADGSCSFDGKKFNNLNELSVILSQKDYTQEQLYKLWHTYNTYTVLTAYTPWLDAMMDCDYAQQETISVLGDRYVVTDPLDPFTYYKTDARGNLIAGRYMIFSESEMQYYGLQLADLTTVERKIIDLQKNVYNEAINLLNYYNLSEEVLIQAYAMIQTFEFNKMFSQTSIISTDYILYPQGYELKAFSYDAYLRMIVSEASGESLMTGSSGGEGNTSIYQRVMSNTSLFFGIFLLANDVLAVYVIPGLRLFFLVVIFLCSILIVIASACKMELKLASVLWKSLLAPLLSFCAVSIGMSLIVSMFLGSGADGVVSSAYVIDLGDPTTAVIVMIAINVLVTVLYFRICRKCFKDMRTYFKAVIDNIGATVAGAAGVVGTAAVGLVGGGIVAGAIGGRGASAVGSKLNAARSAKQRGIDNNPRSGKSGVGAGQLEAKSGTPTAGVGKASSKASAYNAKASSKYSKMMTKAEKADIKAEKADKRIERANSTRKKSRAMLSKKRQTERAERIRTRAESIKKVGVGATNRKAILQGVKSLGSASTYTGAARRAGAVVGRRRNDIMAAKSAIKSAPNAAKSAVKNVNKVAGETLDRGIGTVRRVPMNVKQGLSKARNVSASMKRSYNYGYNAVVDRNW